MAATALTTGLPSISALRRMQGLVPGLGKFGPLSYPGGKVFCRKTQGASREERMPPEYMHRRGKRTPRSPDFKPAWVDLQLAALDAGMKMPPESVSTWVDRQDAIERLGGHEGPLDIGMCRKLCENGRISDAVDALNLRVQQGCHVHNNLFYLVLKRCIARNDLVMGRRIHVLTLKSGYEGDAFLATHLISLYASNGRLEEAMQVFNKVSIPTVYNWTTIIFACARHGEATQAIQLYRQMLESTTIQPDNRLYVAVLKACSSAGDLVAGKEVHAHILAIPGKPDIFVEAGLVNMYAKCGSLEDARRVFDTLPERDVVTWTALIAGYTQQGMGEEALSVYSSMQHEGLNPPDSVTYVCLLHACASVGGGALDQGKQLHAEIEERGLQEDLVLGGSLVNMYAKCGSLEDARRVFDILPKRNVVTWNALLAGYAQQGMGQEALVFYSRMEREGSTAPDSVTYVCLLQACASVGVGAVSQGKKLHVQIEERGLQNDLVLGRSLVNMYAKCGSLVDARRVFDRLPERDVVTWNAMLAGYAQQGMGQEALSLYSRMQHEGSTAPDSVTYVSLLQACATVGVGAMYQGKQLHAQIEERGLQNDLVLGGSLVNMYSKCGSLGDARRLFDRLPERDVVTWNALLTGYAQQGMGEEAFSLYGRMQQEDRTAPDSVTYVCLLQACASVGVGAVDQGKGLHGEIEERGLEDDLVLGGSLVNMYAKCGSLVDARRVFDRLPERNVVTWNALLAGYAQEGLSQEALSLYSRMQQEGSTAPDSVTYGCLLQACASIGLGALDLGKKLHVQIEERGLQEESVVGGSLVNMYAKCGSLGDAQRVFDRLPERNVLTWTALIAGYAQQVMGQEALSLFSRMKMDGLTAPNPVTYVCLLKACACVGVGALDQGKQLHAEIKELGLEEHLVLGGSLINMYAKCGSLGDACRVFDTLRERDVGIWNALLAGYAQQGMGREALSLYNWMQQEGLTPPNSVTYVCLLQACATVGVGAVDQGKQLHADIEEQGLQGDLVLGGSLVNMYAKCGSLGDALSLFDTLQERDVVTWNAILAGYAQQGMGQEALSLYSRMQQEGRTAPDSVTYVCLLQACASVGVGALDQGKQFHSQIEGQGLEQDLVLRGSLVNMYAKCGSLEDARREFDSHPVQTVVTWNALLSGYAQQETAQEALSLYSRMEQEGLTPNSVTYVCVLQACAFVAALPLGKQLHAQIEERGLLADVTVGAGLVNMYAKCGSMFDSQHVFDSLPERSIGAWNALTNGYARQGDSVVVFQLVDRMRLEGIQPDGITFLCLLTVCSHVGQVDKGRMYFKAMKFDYGISPTIEHYTCMMDLLGRAGHLEEALRIAKTMPFPPNGVVWHTLLGACRKWKNVEIGEQAFEFAVMEDEKDVASYVLMSNIYASAEMWEEAKEMQARRKKCGAWKNPGQCWWTDMGGVVHTFVVWDKNHPENGGMYARLEQLFPKTKNAGYMPQLHSSLPGISDEGKEAESCGHSEKLAIAYAVNKTPDGTIVKNLGRKRS